MHTGLDAQVVGPNLRIVTVKHTHKQIAKSLVITLTQQVLPTMQPQIVLSQHFITSVFPTFFLTIFATITIAHYT